MFTLLMRTEFKVIILHGEECLVCVYLICKITLLMEDYAILSIPPITYS